MQDNIIFKYSFLKKYWMVFVLLFLFCGGSIVEAAQKETFTFDVKKFGLKVGESTLEFNGLQQIEGRELLEVVFTVNAPQVYDEERIYMDPQNQYPVLVFRDLDIFGKKEKIREDYEAVLGKVIITKDHNGEVTTDEIVKEGQLDNIYCFIYRYRLSANFQAKESLLLHLPTKDIKMDFMKSDEISAAGEKRKSFLLQSDPKQYRVWFGMGDQKLPLRIDGAVGLGSTAMILKSFEII